MRQAVAALDVALEYLREGWMCIPIPHREKNPGFQGWEELRLDTREKLAGSFNGALTNIGVLLGPPSGDVIDVDLDMLECRAFARIFLPDTRQFGRKSNPLSHWLYRVSDARNRTVFKFEFIDAEDAGKKKSETILEIRGNRHQTVFPGSTHKETGEPILWVGQQPLHKITFAELHQRCARVAVGAVLARYWPREKGHRHECALALSGLLLRAGFTEDEAECFIGAIATIAGNEAEIHNNTVETTKAALDAGKKVTGWTRLSELLDVGLPIANVPTWLGYTGQLSEARMEQKEEPAVARNFNLTDAGNGEFFAWLHRDRFRHDHSRGRDLLFDGHRWRQDATDELIQMAKQAARERYLRAAGISDLELRRKTAAWAIQSETKARIDAALAMARTEPTIADHGNDWDNRPMLLAVANGVVDLETGNLRDGTTGDRLILHTPIAYDADARCPLFEKFFVEILNRDPDLVDFVQRAIGYSLTGLTIEQVLFILWGTGANGKSVLLSILRAVFGEYAYNMPFSTVELKDRANIPNDVAALGDRRLVTAAETNDGDRFNEARIKALTGCDPMTARFLHREFFTFRPVAKFWLSVNHKPRVLDNSPAFWRRVRLIPFLRQFREDADLTLESKLREELPGILAFCVRGTRYWRERGLKAPDSIVKATEEYRQDSDPLGRFITERCTVGECHTVQAGTFYKAYVLWAEIQGFRDRDEVMTATAFGRQMGERFKKDHGEHGTFYSGVALCC